MTLATHGGAETLTEPGAAPKMTTDVAPGRLPARMLVLLRWSSIALQIVALTVASRVLHYRAPWLMCFLLVGAAAAFNLYSTLLSSRGRGISAAEYRAQIAFDLVQLSAVLWLTGGIANPFCILFIVPVAVAGSTLPRRGASTFAAFAVVFAIGLAATAPPLTGPAGGTLGITSEGKLAALAALVSGLAFTAGYAVWTTADNARTGLALHVTETVLAREQRLSALGGLAAAAAHELGTPLATISVVAKELAREVSNPSQKADVLLLVEQAQRCRDILKRLAETPDTTDALYERMSLLQLAREVLAPYQGQGPVRAEAVVSGPPGMAAPDLWRRAEVLQGLAAIVENAFDFAKAEILVSARFDADAITIVVRDDGPGFSPEVIDKLGEPYVTSRPGAEGSRTGHIGMGLGVFIAKTLLQRSGADVIFRNGKLGGATVTVRWPRAVMEAREPGLPDGGLSFQTA
ncbi:MAG: ActS/PrrB/RegB family redox-sensitive histidine kinase [Caulobacteraceae bacterium]|nr:ActS/PrrB/RegB family redox-sensitive histidine kinase [Caulobacteraceae bacterium]